MLPAFELLIPSTVSEACKMKIETGGKFFAGGTDILVAMHSGKEFYPVLIDLKNVGELSCFRTENGLEFGALTTHCVFETNTLVKEHYTALFEGCSQVGSPQIRARGTVGGNICNAVPSADSIGPLLVFDAACVIAGINGERTVRLCDFFTGAKKTALGEGELLKQVLVPKPQEGTGSAYTKFTRRNAMDLALFGVSCSIVLDGDRIQTVRISLTTAAPTPMRATDAESFLTGKVFTEAALIEAAELTARQAKPRTSWRSPAEFRTALAKELTVRTVNLAAKRAKGE